MVCRRVSPVREPRAPRLADSMYARVVCRSPWRWQSQSSAHTRTRTCREHPFSGRSRRGRPESDCNGIERGDEVIDHKIEVCAELDAGDCDETDWTVLVADHPQEPSSTRSNMYKHEGLPAGSTRHYRVSSRNDDGFGAPSTVRSATTNSMVLVPECAGAFWSAEVTVARGLVFDKRGYISPSFGSISDSGFSRRAATYTVTQLYFNQTSRFAEDKLWLDSRLSLRDHYRASGDSAWRLRVVRGRGDAAVRERHRPQYANVWRILPVGLSRI